MKISNTIQQGTHLKVSRGIYTHHGIYVGNGNVVHYSGLAHGFNKGKIELTSLKKFMGEANELKYVKYDTTIQTYAKDEICERALRRLNEDKYNILFNNCEHFACWCVTGRKESKQVQAVMQLTTTVFISVGVTIAAPTTVKAAGSLIGLAGGSVITKVAAAGTTTSAAVGVKALVATGSAKVAASSSVIGVSHMVMAAPVVGSTVGLGAVVTAGGVATTSVAAGTTMGFMAAAPLAIAGAPLVAGAVVGAAVFTSGALLLDWLTE